MICLYHLDDDGKCAANLVHRLGQKDEYEDQFFEMNYGFKVPFDKIHPNEIVYIVDFSLDTVDMVTLYVKYTQNIIWIDHHKSAIDKYENFPYDINGIRSTKYSGCMLTYLYLTNNCSKLNLEYNQMIKEAEVPQLVQLCDDYDMWRFNLPNTHAFHAGFELVDHTPTDHIWEWVTSDEIDRICLMGQTIEKYRASLMSKLIQSYGFESTLDGRKCYVLNQGLAGSDDFKNAPEGYDMFVSFVYNGKDYSYSLRSPDDAPPIVDIAQAHGGGGHPHAAGFSSPDLLV
ncbi:MAG: phosphohydrolase [Lachnospiraceae bacterium]|nr:phosphohydrolase [Lachnospiraceae bacterium]